MNLPRNLDLWLPAYIRDRILHRAERRPAKRLWVSVCDHYEPLGGKASMATAHTRVAVWQRRWPGIALNAPADASGRQPCYTFFYPQEEYNRGLLNSIGAMTRSRLADVEVHIHHNHDTAEGFTTKIETFKNRLYHDHGLLHSHNGRIVFGFIHGNWALDNARPDGMWCGVTGELQLLRDLGCYADFTMPSIPSPTQSRILNRIYWTTGKATLPRGFDHGIGVTVGGGTQGDLLMIPGPAGLRYRGRFIPRIETGELAHYDPPTPYRIERQIDLSPRLGDDIFLKLFAHGAREDNAASLLGTSDRQGTLASMFQWIHEEAQRRDLELHWASAYEMFLAVEKLIDSPPLPHGHTIENVNLVPAGAHL